jgi:glycosyltransferase involved in cell wall biosynthesis
LVSRFRSYDGAGDPGRQAALARRGAALAARLLAGPLRRWRPQLWFTYHLYHKAPDWLGPAVAAALRIPYVLAEASYAPKRAGGPWAIGHAAVAKAIAAADAVVFLNDIDRECVAPLMRRGARAVRLRPFLDATPLASVTAGRQRYRRRLARAHAIPAEEPWLIAVGMMRPGDKLGSYAALATALARLARRRWRLLVVGDGPARTAVERRFSALRGRVTWLGALSGARLRQVYAAADMLVWPAVNEAIGLAVLEAQAAGLPAVVGEAGALAAIVADGKTGCLVRSSGPRAFAAATARLLDDGRRRHAFGRAAKAKVQRLHDLPAAAKTLDRALRAARRRYRA